MAKAIVRPEALEEFARDLNQFTAYLKDSMRKVQGEFGSVGDAWRDTQHERFAEEFSATMRILQQFIEEADRHARTLRKKAEIIGRYLTR